MNIMTHSMKNEEAEERARKLRSLSIARSAPAATEAHQPARRRSFKGLLVTVVGLQAAALAWLAFGDRVAAPEAPPSTAAAAAPAGALAKSNVPGARFEAQGFVVATRQATVSTRVAGIVTSVAVEAGDRVVKGQVLGTLDADLARRDLQLASKQIGALQARVRSAEAQQRQANAERYRENQLFERQFSTRARHLEVQTGVEVATASLDSARADVSVAALQVEQQRSMVSNYTIRAPFAGIVTERNAQPGELIAPSAGGGFTRTGLCTIVDMDSLEVTVDVNEQQVTKVRAGQEVRITLYAYPDVTYRGRIARIMPSADRAKGTLQVRIAFTDKDARVLPDMGARIAFL